MCDLKREFERLRILFIFESRSRVIDQEKPMRVCLEKRKHMIRGHSASAAADDGQNGRFGTASQQRAGLCQQQLLPALWRRIFGNLHARKFFERVAEVDGQTLVFEHFPGVIDAVFDTRDLPQTGRRACQFDL